MTYQRRGAIARLVSDPFDEWTSSETPIFAEFAGWMEDQLQELEMRYANWSTLGYSHWRSSFSRQLASRETEAGAAE